MVSGGYIIKMCFLKFFKTLKNTINVYKKHLVLFSDVLSLRSTTLKIILNSLIVEFSLPLYCFSAFLCYQVHEPCTSLFLSEPITRMIGTSTAGHHLNLHIEVIVSLLIVAYKCLKAYHYYSFLVFK